MILSEVSVVYNPRQASPSKIANTAGEANPSTGEANTETVTCPRGRGESWFLTEKSGSGAEVTGREPLAGWDQRQGLGGHEGKMILFYFLQKK